MMTADQERFKRTRIAAKVIGMFGQFAELPQGRRADAEQSAHFTGAIDCPPLNVLGGQSPQNLLRAEPVRWVWNGVAALIA
jgi:hypothetical protein